MTGQPDFIFGPVIALAAPAVSAEVVGVPYAGITLAAQQNEGLGQGVEPRFHNRFQELQRLVVVVVHQRHHQ